MPKKSKSLTVRGEIEILHPVEPVPNLKAALERMVEQKIAEMMGDNQDGIFEPFFQAPAIAAAIRKLETAPQQHKWQYYFEEWGCLICARKEGHFTLGMCAACYHRTRMRLQRILKRAATDRPEHAPARDLQDVARKALRAASDSDDSVLGTAGIPALEVETRPYVTKAERTLRRAETLHQAKALRFEKGLTWREVTQRLDPKGFANDPEHATERLRVAVHNYFPPDIRKPGQAKIAQRRQERSAQRKEIWRQATALHVEQNLTWREIARRLDPDFDKNPTAATARIEMGAHRSLACSELVMRAKRFSLPEGKGGGSEATQMKSTKQQEHIFTRALGQRPFLNNPRLKTIATLDLLSEAFGPPERIRSRHLIYWNFSRDDNAKGFSLFSRVSKLPKRGEVEAVLCARVGAKAFGDWTIDRLCGLESGEETPFFVGGGRYAVVRIE